VTGEKGSSRAKGHHHLLHERKVKSEKQGKKKTVRKKLREKADGSGGYLGNLLGLPKTGKQLTQKAGPKSS